MLKIRLRRMGSNRRPVYRVVVSDGRKPPTSAVVEEVGYYNPRSQPSEVRLDRDRIDHYRPFAVAGSAAVGHREELAQARDL